MRDMKEFHELYHTWEKTLDKLTIEMIQLKCM